MAKFRAHVDDDMVVMAETSEYAPAISIENLKDMLVDSVTSIDKATVAKVESISLWKAHQVFSRIVAAQRNLHRAIDILSQGR